MEKKKGRKKWLAIGADLAVALVKVLAPRLTPLAELIAAIVDQPDGEPGIVELPEADPAKS